MTAHSGANGSVLLADRRAMCYCPGCTHGNILEALGEAIDRTGIPSRNICIVSDIGCIGTADRYFNCNTFHGLHGRALTYAEGIKRMRPELTVIVLIGDGGCGIGTAHLVHAARRGIGIKVLVCNNFNFGMTGGQHSPTTPSEMFTTTTPDGVIDRPFDVCQTVIANGASHVGRFNALEASCREQIELLLRLPGFGLLDLWELCVAYFVPENKLKPAALAEMSCRFNLPMGWLLHADNHRSSPVARDRVPKNLRRLIPEARPLAWPGRRELCVAGSAGQRIRSAAGVFGEIAVSAGLFAAQVDDFPITVRKGHSISNLIVSNHAIRYTAVESPDLVLITNSEGAGRLRLSEETCSKAVIIADHEVEIGQAVDQLVRIDYPAIEKAVGKASAALAALSFAIVQARWLEPEQLFAAADAAITGPYRDENLRAVRTGIALQPAVRSDFRLSTLTHQESSHDP